MLWPDTHFLGFPAVVLGIRSTSCGTRTHSLTRREGRVGTNLSFCVPRRVTSPCFLARLAMAFGGFEPEPEPEPEPDAPEFAAGWSDMEVVVVECKAECCG